MITITIEDAQVTEALQELQGRMTDMTKPMDDIGELLIRTTRERFGEGKSPDGVPWAAKSLATIEAYRRRAGKGVNTRVDTRPLHGPSGALQSTIFKRTGPDFVEVGSPQVYAAVMQFGALEGAFGQTGTGSPIPWGTIPARPFLGISDTDRTAILEILTEWLEDAAD